MAHQRSISRASTHAVTRAKQRGIKLLELELIEEHGDRFFAEGGAYVCYMGWRAVARAFARFGVRLDHLKNTALVIADSGVYVTTYKRSRPLRHWRAA